MTLSTTIRDWRRQLFGSPEHDRLTNYIADAWADLDREIQNADLNREVDSTTPMSVTKPWARSACTLLLRAEDHLANWEIEGGWAAALSAQRAIISNPGNLRRIQLAAMALRREVDKITGWRAKAIQDLICDGKGELISIDAEQRMCVIEAVALRDDFSQNTWFKINLRRRHLSNLFFILWSAILLCLVLSWCRIMPGFLSDIGQVSAVVLFGVLGAAVSVAQSLLSQDVSARIPTQQMGALVIWMRPGIGAAASLVVFALLHANKEFRLLGDHSTDPAVVAVFSFVAGYSERFIVGALERIAPSSAK